jgi:lipocalin
MISLISLAFVVFAGTATATGDSPLMVVDAVDLNRYLGKWYEIASYPAVATKSEFRSQGSVFADT